MASSNALHHWRVIGPGVSFIYNLLEGLNIYSIIKISFIDCKLIDKL